jgi:hypothetical protein
MDHVTIVGNTRNSYKKAENMKGRHHMEDIDAEGVV